MLNARLPQTIARSVAGSIGGNDGRIRLFDFGYMYRFDPLRACNSNGLLTPQHHGAERFETRCYYAHLLRLERECGQSAALAALEPVPLAVKSPRSCMPPSMVQRKACKP